MRLEGLYHTPIAGVACEAVCRTQPHLQHVPGVPCHICNMCRVQRCLERGAAATMPAGSMGPLLEKLLPKRLKQYQKGVAAAAATN